MKQKWLYRVLMAFFCLTFLVSGFFLARYFWSSHKQKQQTNTLADIVEKAKAEIVTVKPTPTDETSSSEDKQPMPVIPDTTNPADSEHVEIEDPDTGEKIRLLKEYAPIYAMNTDTVGWIKIEDTDINYPVMQNTDYRDYYLYLDFHEEYSNHGSIYAREECDVFEPSDNITIYGHRMRDGMMFWDLQNYKKSSYWEDHRYITFDTIKEHHTYEIFAVFLTTASIGEGFPYHEFVDADSAEQFDKYVRTCKDLAIYDTGITPQYGDKLITLSTCEYSQTNGRLVVVAKRITE